MAASFYRHQRNIPEPNEGRLGPRRIPAPSYRHAAPSGPWPWMDLDFDPGLQAPVQRFDRPASGDDTFWSEYPQSLFPNWTDAQVKKSGMKEKIEGSHACAIRQVDVDDAGQFSYTRPPGGLDEFWKEERPEHLRVRALFIENLTVPVMQILGSKYNIEPFFFSSSLNWIPSRFQEELRPGQGDHITITLTFLRTIRKPERRVGPATSRATDSQTSARAHARMVDRTIDTQLPLDFTLRSSDKQSETEGSFVFDLLAIHMIRKPESSTIISYHPSYDRDAPEQLQESAKRLHSRIGLAGQSVYWQNIFKTSDDPTFVFLTMIWHALYSWDEAIGTLWDYISQLESSAISTNSMDFTQKLHTIRAHLLHYSFLLDDFRKSVLFVLQTPNPAMDSPHYNDKARKFSRNLLKKECNNLLMEINRLSMSREMQDRRLKNVMNLVFSSANIELTEAAMRDSAAMKQIAYLTMIFLPASFCAGLFGMNVREVAEDGKGSVVHYVEVAIPFTLITIWILLAFQGQWTKQVGLWERLSWPFTVLVRVYGGLMAILKAFPEMVRAQEKRRRSTGAV